MDLPTHQSRRTGQGRAHLEVHEWKTEETTVGTWTVPEGTVLERRVRVLQGSPRGHVDSSSIYLIRGSCLYQAEWDSATHRLTQRFLEGIRTYSSPDFCFPLVVNKTWGAPHGLPDWDVTRPEDARDWRVESITRHDPLAPGGQSTFRVSSISAYPGGGVTLEIWFEKGVGVVREVEIHHGTIGEERTRLISFTSAQ